MSESRKRAKRKENSNEAVDIDQDSLSEDSEQGSSDSEELEVDEEYIQDDFNLTGLASLVPNYDYALDMILDVPNPDLTPQQVELVQSAAEELYGLVHARFILSSRGLAQMLDKYSAAEFGKCPRVFCQSQPVLPVGQADLPHTHTVKLFCPKCQDLYYPKNPRHANLDGGYFGTTFPHLLLQTYPELVPTLPALAYKPRIFGFRIHKSSSNYPRPASTPSKENKEKTRKH